ncbi:unnamed protein product [Caenorhabditis bovis]|uniref:SEA domain-containing protein n=1 Tax=Caenorhabditis bovis TaxID=2654633 RepID=A0A8S1EJ88_9PELO|nr:unnamed protein product [Caenorhabditis bovis]
MSYNHHLQSQGYVPSYTSQNTGAAYMARRGWDSSNNSDQNTISFTSKSRKKTFYIIAFVLLLLLSIAAIVIIILFACGVFYTSDPLQNPTTPPIFNPTYRPPFDPYSTPHAPIFGQNASFSCTFAILRQASETFDVKNTNAYYASFTLIQNAGK